MSDPYVVLYLKLIIIIIIEVADFLFFDLHILAQKCLL